jgi:hypothetical protein
MPASPEYFDPYIGKVFGNILDYYDSPTYNLKLYMIDEASMLESKSEFGLATDNLIAPPASTVILAQTGVTGTQIDDLEIMSVVTGSDGAQANAIKFTVIQPGAATFMDQLQLAKVYLGQANANSVTMYLEVRFQGYQESDLGPSDVEWDPDTGGDTEVVAGPFRYKFNITQVRVAIDQGGSRYQFEGVASASYAFTDTAYKIPKTINTVGKTITEHVEDFKAKLNEWSTDATNDEVPDEVDFDLSALIGGESGGESYDLIADDTLISNTDGDAEDTNRQMNETSGMASATERNQALEDAPKDSGDSTEVTFDGDKISVPEGASMRDYFDTLLSMNEEYLSKVTRKSDLTNPEDDAIDSDQPFISWMRMNADVKQTKFDKSRNKYATKTTYIPTIYKSVRRDVAVDIKETEISDGRKVIDGMIGNNSLLKSYNYLFTGLNDQIKSLDIKYDYGLDMLLAPKYGAVGDVSITASDVLSNTVPEDKDLTIEGQIKDLLDAGKNAAEKSSLSSLLGDLKKFMSEATGAIDQIANAVGQTSNDLINLINSGNAADQRAFIDSLDDATRKSIAANSNTFATAAPTIDPAIAPPEYEPTFSGYAYGADFLNPGQTYPDIQRLEDLGYINLNGKTGADDKDAKVVKQGVSRKQDFPSKVQGGTYKSGSVQNKLLGFIAGQHSDTQFMLEVELLLRGDPWYLGKQGTGVASVKEKSDEEGANHKGDDNCFFLNINAPITYDPDYSDEDSELNSGYWDMSGEARTFGGVYRMIKVTNNFRGGVFECLVTGHRVLDPAAIDYVKSQKTEDDKETGTE